MSAESTGKGWLRTSRSVLAGAMARAIYTVPAFEPFAIRAGRAAARRSRVFAGVYWFVQESLLARLQGRDTRFRPVDVCGHRLQLDVSDLTGRLPYFYGTPYEPPVTDAIYHALKPGDVFVDVGANIGYFTVLAARAVSPDGRVVAFEPHRGARERLETLVRRNDAAARVEIVPQALADADGEATLFIEDAISAHSTLEPSLSPMRHVAALRPSTLVQVTTLDGWMAAHPDLAARVRCVKIDVEGAEGRVLAGMRRMLESRSLTIVCETTIGSPADAALAAAGFERRRIEPGSGPYGNFLYVRP